MDKEDSNYDKRLFVWQDATGTEEKIPEKWNIMFRTEKVVKIASSLT